MKIRAKANNNVLDLPDGEAEALLATGIYEKDDGADAVTVTKDSTPDKGRHKRKDLRAEP